MRKFYNIALSIVPLIIGGMLYIGYRSQELLMFRWVSFLGLSNAVSLWRSFCALHPLPGWIYYALPDGVWLLSYLLLIDVVWDSEQNKWLYALPIIALISEVLQLWIPILGTFDIMDLACYIGAVILFELKNITRWKRKKL